MLASMSHAGKHYSVFPAKIIFIPTCSLQALLCEQKRRSITLRKNVSATYVGIDQRLLRTHPNFIRRVISCFVRAHHGKIRRYIGGLVKRRERPPRLSCPFNAVLFGGWSMHGRAYSHVHGIAWGRSLGARCWLAWFMPASMTHAGKHDSCLPTALL